MSQPSHKAAYTRFSIRITSGDYSRIDFYGLVDKRPDTGDGGLRNSLLSTGIGPASDPRPRIVMTDSSTGERTLLEAPAENVYFHLWAQLKEGAAYQLEVRGLTVTYAYLSECADIMEKGIRLIDMSPAREGAGIPGGPPSQTTTHFEPPCRWMNDPNGLCRFQGRYHLFYQFNPFGWKWGPMHWGHAVSGDMIHWTHLPLAMDPQAEIYSDSSYAGGAFSGSAIPVDGQGRPCPGDKAHAIRFFLTCHLEKNGDPAHQVEYQATCLSLDGIHLSQPSLVIGHEAPGLAPDFRDPKIDMTALEPKGAGSRGRAVIVAATNLPARLGEDFRRAQGVESLDDEHMSGDGGWFAPNPWDRKGEWEADHSSVPAIVAYTAAAGADLSRAGSWHYAGPLLMDYRHGVSRTYECPDFFKLDGRLVAIGALMHYRDGGGRFQPVRWYVGDIATAADAGRGLRMRVASSGWCDGGDSYYAVQSFVDDSGRRIAIGWVADWFGIRNPATSPANGVMTYPRQLHLRQGHLISHPVEEVYEELLGPSIAFADDGNLAEKTGRSYYADLRLFTGDAAVFRGDFDLILASKGDCRLHLLGRKGRIRLATDGLPTDRLNLVIDLPAVSRVEVFMDGTVCELFLNDGEEAATVLFDDPHGSGSSDQTGLRIVHGGECFSSFDVHGLRSLNKRRVAR